MGFPNANGSVRVQGVRECRECCLRITDLGLDVFGPGVAGFGGVFLGDLVAVAEHFGDQQEQHAGDALGQTFGAAGEQFSEPGQSLVLGDCGGCLRLSEADLV
jgi:hypothetical protein